MKLNKELIITGLIILFILIVIILSCVTNNYFLNLLILPLIVIGYLCKTKKSKELFGGSLLIDIKYDELIYDFINPQPVVFTGPSYLDNKKINNILDENSIIDYNVNYKNLWYIQYVHNLLIKFKEQYDMMLIGYDLDNIDIQYKYLLDSINYINDDNIINIVLDYIFKFDDIKNEHYYLNDSYKQFIYLLSNQSNKFLTYQTQVEDNIIKIKVNDLDNYNYPPSILYDYVSNQNFLTYSNIIKELKNKYQQIKNNINKYQLPNNIFNINNVFIENIPNINIDQEIINNKYNDIEYFNKTYNNSNLYNDIIKNIFNNDNKYSSILEYYMTNQNIFDLEPINDEYLNIDQMINKLKRINNFFDNYNYNPENLSNHLILHIAYLENLILNDFDYKNKLNDVNIAINNIIKKNTKISRDEQYKLTIILNDIDKFDIKNTHKTYFAGLSQQLQTNIIQLQTTNKIFKCKSNNLRDCIDNKIIKNITFDNFSDYPQYESDPYLVNLYVLYQHYQELANVKIFSNKLNEIKNYILDKIKNDSNIKILVDDAIHRQNILNDVTLKFKEKEFDNTLNLINNTYQQIINYKQIIYINSIIKPIDIDINEYPNINKILVLNLYKKINNIYSFFIINHLDNTKLINYLNKIVKNYLFIKVIGSKTIQNIILDDIHKLQFLLYIFDNNIYINLDQLKKDLNQISEQDCSTKINKIKNDYGEKINLLTNKFNNQVKELNQLTADTTDEINNLSIKNQTNLDKINELSNQNKSNLDTIDQLTKTKVNNNEKINELSLNNQINLDKINELFKDNQIYLNKIEQLSSDNQIYINQIKQLSKDNELNLNKLDECNKNRIIESNKINELEKKILNNYYVNDDDISLITENGN